MSNLPFTLPSCDQPATVRIEVYSPADGRLHGSLDAVVYTCDQHGIETVSAIQAAGLTAHRDAAPGVEINRTCGYTHAFVEFAKPAVVHPEWCIKGRMCVGDGIHHSRPVVANSADAQDAVRVWLERPWSIDVHSAVLETTVDGEVHYAYLTIGQARILRHQLGRLLDLSKAGQR